MPANTKQQVGHLPYYIAEEQFRPCPFCGCDPNVIEVPSMTHDHNVWAVECKNLGCVIGRTNTYGLLRDLRRDWNVRASDGGAA